MGNPITEYPDSVPGSFVHPPFDRTRGLGGSDAAAIMGLSPWRDRLDVWMEKTHHPHWREKPMSPALEWGQILEPVVRERYTHDTSIAVIPGPAWDDEPMWSPNGIQFAHVDGWSIEGGIAAGVFEAKTAGHGDGWETGIPLHYRIQLQQYMAVTELPWCDLAVLIGGNDFRIYREEADLGMQMDIENACLEFWETVKSGVSDVDSIPAIIRYPTQDQELEPIAATAELDLAAKTLLEIRRRGKDNAELATPLVEQIQGVVKLHPGADGDGWYLIWREAAAPKTVGWEQIAVSLWNLVESIRREMGYGVKEIPEDVARYLDPKMYKLLQSMYTTTGKPTRPFLLKEGKRP